MEHKLKIILIFFVGLMPFQSFSQEWRSTVITDPAISARCEKLSYNRDDKIKHKQRLMDLIARSQKLRAITPKRKRSIKTKLVSNYGQLQHELDLTRLKIEDIEESIIRKGCPGISI